jgi:hypothetical protein
MGWSKNDGKKPSHATVFLSLKTLLKTRVQVAQHAQRVIVFLFHTYIHAT